MRDQLTHQAAADAVRIMDAIIAGSLDSRDHTKEPPAYLNPWSVKRMQDWTRAYPDTTALEEYLEVER